MPEHDAGPAVLDPCGRRPGDLGSSVRVVKGNLTSSTRSCDEPLAVIKALDLGRFLPQNLRKGMGRDEEGKKKMNEKVKFCLEIYSLLAFLGKLHRVVLHGALL